MDETIGTALLRCYIGHDISADNGLAAARWRAESTAALDAWCLADSGRPYDGGYMADSRGALAHLAPAERRFLDHHRESKAYSRWAERGYQRELAARKRTGAPKPTRAEWFSGRVSVLGRLYEDSAGWQLVTTVSGKRCRWEDWERSGPLGVGDVVQLGRDEEVVAFVGVDDALAGVECVTNASLLRRASCDAATGVNSGA